MQQYCSGLVRGMGKAWPALGWTLWVVILIIPFIPFIGAILYPIYLGARILLGVWAIVDVASQDLVTTFLGSLLLFLFVALVAHPGGLFFVIGWLVYWNAVRKAI